MDRDDAGVKHRLKRKDLVKYIFIIFSGEYDKSDAETIWDIEIPVEKLRIHLKEKYGVDYTSNSYIYSQLKHYEEEIGLTLFKFEKSKGNEQNIIVFLNSKMSAFYQNHHLYATRKIKIANGVYGMIRNFRVETGITRPVNILLGSGTIPYHIAIILRDKSSEENRYSIYTHNLGIIEELHGPGVNHKYFDLHIPAGKINYWINAIIGNDNNLYKSIDFDFIVQSTKHIYKGEVYVDDREEKERKEIILKECKGVKILTLIKDELVDHPLKDLSPFGAITDYDYLVVPRMSSNVKRKRKYDLMFERYQDLLAPEIVSWNFIIYKVI
jgi:DeoR/GlpR family transcriptional regulator of sugar metabolism